MSAFTTSDIISAVDSGYPAHLHRRFPDSGMVDVLEGRLYHAEMDRLEAAGQMRAFPTLRVGLMAFSAAMLGLIFAGPAGALLAAVLAVIVLRAVEDRPSPLEWSGEVDGLAARTARAISMIVPALTEEEMDRICEKVREVGLYRVCQTVDPDRG